MSDRERGGRRIVVDRRRGGAGMVAFGVALAIAVLVGVWYLYSLERPKVTTTEVVVDAGPVRR